MPAAPSRAWGNPPTPVPNLPLDEVPVPRGTVDFDEHQALNFCLEVRTDAPASPSDGRIWLRSDL